MRRRRVATPCSPIPQNWEVEHKLDKSPLTRADREANAIICRGLRLLCAFG